MDNSVPNQKIMNQQTFGKIFIVDDDPFWTELLMQILRNNGYEDLTVFTNGTDCLASLSESPGLILLDYSMDTLNGIEVLRKIKRVDPNISVVFISSQEDLEVAVTSLRYGAFDYIVKGRDEATKLPKVISRLAEVKALLARQKKGLIKNIFSFI